MILITHQEDKNIIENSSHNLVQPHLGRIFFARLFDLVVCSIPTILLVILNPIVDWKTFLINLPISQIILFIYFVLIPFLLKGNTLGKLFFSLRLKKENGQTLKLREVFYREFYFLYIPLLIQIVIQIILGIILFANIDEEDKKLSILISNIGFSFIGIWFIYIPLTIYLQQEHLSAIDLKVGTRVYYLEKVIVVTKKEKRKHHVHLQNDRPGNFNLEEIDKIIGEDKDTNN